MVKAQVTLTLNLRQTGADSYFTFGTEVTSAPVGAAALVTITQGWLAISQNWRGSYFRAFPFSYSINFIFNNPFLFVA